MSFTNEADLVRGFGAAIDSFPVAGLSPGARHLLVIGNEVALAGAGSGGAKGSADLLAVDDQGELWIIEAKLSSNSEINPSYVFGNQLARYASALLGSTLHTLHPHIQDFAYSRRSILKPHPDLAGPWLTARSLRDMISCWLARKGLPTANADLILARMEARLHRGQFLLAVLTDRNVPALAEWSRLHDSIFHTAVLYITAKGNLEVLTRTPSVLVDVSSPFTGTLPPFDRIPQSFKPLPSTLPLVLSEPAFRLYSNVVLQRLTGLVGDLSLLKAEQSSTSFGYCIAGANELPVLLRIGRGDDYLSRGTPNAQPGSHTLKVDFVFKWACDHILADAREAGARQKLIDDLWRFTSQLVLAAGYRYKNMKRPLDKENLVREFERGCAKRTLLVERAAWHGTRDFGCVNADIPTQALALHLAFDLFEAFLGGRSCAAVLARPPRIPYSNGILGDCRPSELVEPDARAV